MNATRTSRAVVILDRDGTIVKDRGYLDDPSGLEFLPSVPAGLRILSRIDARLIIVTNQSGMGRGLISESQMFAMNRRIFEMFEEAGASLLKIYWCPHLPSTGCACRKPNLDLFRRAMCEMGSAVRTCYVIGDKPSDIEFGKRAGAKTLLISDRERALRHDIEPTARFDRFVDAARWVELEDSSRLAGATTSVKEA